MTPPQTAQERGDRIRRRRALAFILFLFLATNAMVAACISGWSP